MTTVLLLWLMIDQPVPFSHKTHAEAAKLKCADCHAMPDPGERATLPPTGKCMACHVTIKSDSPAVAKLSEAHKAKRNVPWKRIYQIPGYVFFSHRIHTEAGATCANCHGAVAERDVLTKEVETNMGACMSCHMKYKAPNDCTTCHEQRN